MWYETIKNETVKEWDSYPEIKAENPLNGNPIIYCVEARMRENEEGEVYKKHSRLLSENFTDENKDEVFQMININTGEVVGEADYKTAFTMLFSICKHLSQKAKIADEQASLEAERIRLENLANAEG